MAQLERPCWKVGSALEQNLSGFVGDDRASREVDDDELRPDLCLINSFNDGVFGQVGEYFQFVGLVR